MVALPFFNKKLDAEFLILISASSFRFSNAENLTTCQ